MVINSRDLEASYKVTQSHHMLIKSREGSKNQGMKNPPDKTRSDTNTKNYNHPKPKCLDNSLKTQSITARKMSSLESSNPTTIDTD